MGQDRLETMCIAPHCDPRWSRQGDRGLRFRRHCAAWGLRQAPGRRLSLQRREAHGRRLLPRGCDHRDRNMSESSSVLSRVCVGARAAVIGTTYWRLTVQIYYLTLWWLKD